MEAGTMRKELLLNRGWTFIYHDGTRSAVDLPHTWNNKDGQDGGNDYYRGTCTYEKTFDTPEFDPATECVYIEFRGVNATADVTLNGKDIIHHDGGYSTFRKEITGLLTGKNAMTVKVDNSKNDRVYPQKADFTFYGGIYRDVKLLVVSKNHFDLDFFGAPGLMVAAKPDGARANVNVKSWSNTENAAVSVKLLDAEGKQVAAGEGADCDLVIENAHRWHGIKDPYLYSCVCTLLVDGEAVDEISCTFGVRSYRVDPKEGFFLNEEKYPLHGVSRHQDWKGLGNAITKEHHEEDMRLIAEMGCNTIRLAHYQHDQYFYDLCDRYGMVVWAEIPYISEHMPNGRENTVSQMKELIYQNYNHASIVTWGVSNEITISTKDKKDMLDNHHMLNDLVHQLDPTRPTTLACYSMCGPFNKVAHITDLVSWNLYLGWYVPGLFLNDLWIDFFHLVYPNRPLGYSEYGCEAMTNLHSSHPKREDQTEEYQCVYHEYLLRCFAKRPFMWSTHVWNMFDFAADARNQGGEPGMNHKGLITFDRKIKKDSFFLYKAYWSDEKFVHIASRRYVERCEEKTTIRVYTNQKHVALFVNGKKFAEQDGDKVFVFKNVPMTPTMQVKAVAGDCTDQIFLKKVDKPNPAYILPKDGGSGADWATQ